MLPVLNAWALSSLDSVLPALKFLPTLDTKAVTVLDCAVAGVSSTSAVRKVTGPQPAPVLQAWIWYSQVPNPSTVTVAVVLEVSSASAAANTVLGCLRHLSL